MHRRVSKAVPGVADDIGVRISPQSRLPIAWYSGCSPVLPQVPPRGPRAHRGNLAGKAAGRADALRFAPVRSSGFRMPCRERAVEPVAGRGHGDAQAELRRLFPQEARYGFAINGVPGTIWASSVSGTIGLGVSSN
jgi:hypothetical protein